MGRERGDHHPFERSNEREDVGPSAPEHAGDLDDRVSDQLAGTVIGDPPTAVGVFDLDALHPVPVLAHAELAPLAPAPLGQHGGVLEQEQDVADRTGPARCGDLALQPEPCP